MHELYFLNAGEDYISTGLRPRIGNSNLRWAAGNTFPNRRFIVPIIDDDIPEPIEKLEVLIECDGNHNCFIPQRSYTITIVDDQGMQLSCFFSIGRLCM